jgi:hypothetical protein
MVNQINILTNPNEFTTDGYLRIKEWGHDIDLRFLMPKDFRGKLNKITWNTEDNEKHVITSADESWNLFQQVGERPEVIVPSTWLDSLELGGTVRLRIMFSFDTFRQNPDWYAYLYLKTVNGDPNAAYLAGSTVRPGGNPKGGSDSGCCDCEHCPCNNPDVDETDDSLLQG